MGAPITRRLALLRHVQAAWCRDVNKARGHKAKAKAKARGHKAKAKAKARGHKAKAKAKARGFQRSQGQGQGQRSQGQGQGQGQTSHGQGQGQEPRGSRPTRPRGRPFITSPPRGVRGLVTFCDKGVHGVQNGPKIGDATNG